MMSRGLSERMREGGCGWVGEGGGGDSHVTAAQRPAGDFLLFGPYLRHTLPPGRFFGPVFGHKLRAERFLLATHYAAQELIFRYKFKLVYLYQVPW